MSREGENLHRRQRLLRDAGQQVRPMEVAHRRQPVDPPLQQGCRLRRSAIQLMPRIDQHQRAAGLAEVRM